VGTGQKMKVEVENGLAGMVAAIENRAKSASGHAQLGSNMLNRQEKMFKDAVVFTDDIENVGNVFFGHDQYMHGGLGADVFESKNMGVLEYFFTRKRALDNLAENTLFGFHYALSAFLPNPSWGVSLW
jgi:hypothetical protein